LAIIGATSPRLKLSSISYTACGPGVTIGYGSEAMPLSRYHASVTFIGREDAVQRLGLGHHVGDRVAGHHGQLLVAVDELHAHALRLFGAPSPQQLQHDVLAADPRIQPAGEYHAALLASVK
jgi:hypothetical protein